MKKELMKMMNAAAVDRSHPTGQGQGGIGPQRPLWPASIRSDHAVSSNAAPFVLLLDTGGKCGFPTFWKVMTEIVPSDGQLRGRVGRRGVESKPRG